MGRKGRGRGERRERDSFEFPTLCFPPWCLETLETTWPNKPWPVPAIYCVQSGIKMINRGKGVCPFSERLASRDGLEINFRFSFPGEHAQCLLLNWFSPSSSHWELSCLYVKININPNALLSWFYWNTPGELMGCCTSICFEGVFFSSISGWNTTNHWIYTMTNIRLEAVP